MICVRKFKQKALSADCCLAADRGCLAPRLCVESDRLNDCFEHSPGTSDKEAADIIHLAEKEWMRSDPRT
ncbi:MAG: hypothetical protein KKD05_02075 [Candidatus Omnitrophica bacterium]|nr:hypothetical protein [Candidatus Omnitrophota bacterium]